MYALPTPEEGLNNAMMPIFRIGIRKPNSHSNETQGNAARKRPVYVISIENSVISETKILFQKVHDLHEFMVSANRDIQIVIA